MITNFERDYESGLIVVTALLDGEHELILMLDTGASCTTIDSNVLYMKGYPLTSTTSVRRLETSNGIIDVNLYEVGSITSLGLTRCHSSVQVYDFLAHGILSKYDGVLGLDFFEGTRFIIDMMENTIVVEDLQARV